MTVSLVRGKLKLASSSLGHDLATLLILHGRFQSPVRSSFANGIILRMLTCFHLAKNVNPYSTQVRRRQGDGRVQIRFPEKLSKRHVGPERQETVLRCRFVGFVSKRADRSLTLCIMVMQPARQACLRIVGNVYMYLSGHGELNSDPVSCTASAVHDRENSPVCCQGEYYPLPGQEIQCPSSGIREFKIPPWP